MLARCCGKSERPQPGAGGPALADARGRGDHGRPAGREDTAESRMKHVVTADDVHRLAETGERELMLREHTVLTDAARDAADLLGVRLVEGSTLLDHGARADGCGTGASGCRAACRRPRSAASRAGVSGAGRSRSPPPPPPPRPAPGGLPAPARSRGLLPERVLTHGVRPALADVSRNVPSSERRVEGAPGLRAAADEAADRRRVGGRGRRRDGADDRPGHEQDDRRGRRGAGRGRRPRGSRGARPRSRRGATSIRTSALESCFASPS